jgi:uncharacterized protein (TIGR02466 family)
MAEVIDAQDKVAEVVAQNGLATSYYFPSPIYVIEKPEFISKIKEVAEESLAKRRKESKLNDLYPVYMSDNLLDERLSDFLGFAGSTCWNILDSQGYAMSNLTTTFTECWVQEHYKHSAMDQHTHNGSVQIVGFYFLDVPKDSSRAVFHDPRPGKVQINLPETNHSNATLASDIINFDPKPGLLIFSNAWLPHSYTKNSSNKPLRFIHFNLSVQHDPTANLASASSPAEVI